MESKREIFKRQSLEDMYGPAGGEDFADAATHGIYDKIGMQGIVRCYQRVCNRDPELVKLFDAILEYTRINPAAPTAYDTESLLLDDIVAYADKAAVYADKELRFATKELALYRKSSHKLSPEEKKKSDAEILMKFQRAENGVIASSSMKIYFDEIVFGTLPVSECPDGLFHEYDSAESALGHPVFSHDPLGTDISDESRRQSPFFIGLSNYVKKSAGDLISMFCDCGEGIVVVRLWDPETQEPLYVNVGKDDVYFDWIIVGGNPALWPGLICKALEQSGHAVESSDPELLLRMAAGKNPVLSAQDLTLFTPESAKKTPDTSAYEAYFRCLNDIYIACLGTINVNVDEQKPFTDMFDAVKITMGGVFDNFSDNLELLRPAMEFLLQKTRDYRQSADPSRRRTRRLEICDSVEQLYEIFDDPDLRYAPTRVFRSPLGRTLKQY